MLNRICDSCNKVIVDEEWNGRSDLTLHWTHGRKSGRLDFHNPACLTIWLRDESATRKLWNTPIVVYV